jgi:glutaconate CoA-transferase subunit A
MAAAMGLPYLPTRTLLGSDLSRGNPRITPAEHGVLHVAPIEPDVAILQVQRADAQGHAHCWGNLGLSREAGLAARRVILIAEEIVPTDIILSDPNRVLLPPHRVVAVVEEPGSAHPSPVQGYYGRDHAFYTEYHRATREPAGSQAWLQEWVFGVDGRASYLERLGPRWPALKPTQLRPAAPVDYA